MESYSNRIDSARCVNDTEGVTLLPLMDCEMKLLPIHFLTQSEVYFALNIYLFFMFLNNFEIILIRWDVKK